MHCEMTVVWKDKDIALSCVVMYNLGSSYIFYVLLLINCVIACNHVSANSVFKSMYHVCCPGVVNAMKVMRVINKFFFIRAILLLYRVIIYNKVRSQFVVCNIKIATVTIVSKQFHCIWIKGISFIYVLT